MNRLNNYQLSQCFSARKSHLVPREGRVYLSELIRVFDAFSANEFGFLLDITSNGMCVISEHEKAIGDCLELKIINELKNSLSNSVYSFHIDFSAKVKWSKTVNKNTYKYGLSYEPFDEKSRARIVQLLDSL